VPTRQQQRLGRRGTLGRQRGPTRHSAWGIPPRPPSAAERPDRRRWQKPPFADVEWPFWLLMVSPWVAWGLLLLLQRLDVCLACLFK
jgi:hypothetical protein